MTQVFDACIIGGGVVGLTMALALAQRQYNIAIIDQKSLDNDVLTLASRVVALNQTSQNLLSSLGIWPLLALHNPTFYKKMHIWDASSTQAQLDFDATLIGEKSLGCIIQEPLLKNALLQQLRALPQVQWFANQCVTELQSMPTGYQVMSAQASWDTKLLIIADGAQSRCRNLLSIPTKISSYHQEAIIATVHVEKVHQHTAYQIFQQNGPLAFLPLQNPQHCAIVWSTSQQESKLLASYTDAMFNAALTTAFQAHLGDTTVLGTRQVYPLTMRHAHQYIGPNCLLLGDAAHTIHPLAGLGLNLGLEDIDVFFNIVGKNNKILLSVKQQGQYQRQRKTRVWQCILLMDILNNLFMHKAKSIQKLRAFGLFIKRILIAQATGSSI